MAVEPFSQDETTTGGDFVSIPMHFPEEKCAICFDDFRDPRLLMCGHAFCFDCLQVTHSSFKKTWKICCPLCRHNTIVQTKEHLPKYDPTAAEKKGDEKKNVPPNDFFGPIDKTCFDCENEGHRYCYNCKLFMCSNCLVNHHRGRIFLNHLLVDPSEAEIHPPCSFHIQQELKYFCTECSELVCLECKIVSHDSHKIIPINVAAREKRALLLDKLKSVTSHLDFLGVAIREQEEEGERLQIALEQSQTRLEDLREKRYVLEGKEKFARNLIDRAQDSHLLLNVSELAAEMEREIDFDSFQNLNALWMDGIV